MANRFVYIKSSSSFGTDLQTTYKDSLVFLEDERVICTHGQKFGLTPTEIAEIKTSAISENIGDISDSDITSALTSAGLV